MLGGNGERVGGKETSCVGMRKVGWEGERLGSKEKYWVGRRRVGWKEQGWVGEKGRVARRKTW